MGGGNAIEQARETIDGMDDQQLAAASSAYRDPIARVPRRRPARECALTQRMRFRPHRAGVGHRRRGYRQDLVSRRTRAGRPRRLAQTAGKAALVGTEEALQEVGEGVATQGHQRWRKMDLDPLAGSFGNARWASWRAWGRRAAWRSRGRAPPQHGEPTMEAGDVVHASGKPFIRRAARQRAEELGGDAQVLRFENGFIVRPARARLRRERRTRGGGRRGEGCGHASPRTWARWRERVGRLPARPVVCARAAARSPSSSSAWSATPRRPGLGRAAGGSARPTAAGISSACRSCTPTRSPATPCARRPTPPALEGPQAFPVLDRPVERQALPAPKAIPPATASRPAKPGACPRTPRGIRNNNPGNIQKGVGFSGEIEGNDPRFARHAGGWHPRGGGQPADLPAPARPGHCQGHPQPLGAAVGERHRRRSKPCPARWGCARPAAGPERPGHPGPAHGRDHPSRERNAAVQRGADGGGRGRSARWRALRAGAPAPVYRVDGEGVAATSGQRDAELARLGALGMTPDVEAAGQPPGRGETPRRTRPPPHRPMTAPSPRTPRRRPATTGGPHPRGRAGYLHREPQGSERRGTSPDGAPWSNTMAGHYGYIRRTAGADGDQVDVFVRPGTAPDFSGPVFVIDQLDAGGRGFDESKVMLGYDTREAAEQAYATAMRRTGAAWAKSPRWTCPHSSAGSARATRRSRPQIPEWARWWPSRISRPRPAARS